jgi:transposase
MVGIVDMLEVVETRQKRLKAEMEEFLRVLPEAQSLLSLPGIGTITVAGLLGECGNIGAYKSYGQLEKFVGLNLYEVSSGKHIGRRRISKRGRSLARYLICSVAMPQTRSGGLFEQCAKEMRAKGKKTGEIRVAVARKLLRLLYAVAREQREFDPRQFFTGARTEDGLVIHQGTQAQAA